MERHQRAIAVTDTAPVNVVVVAYGDPQLLENCLASLQGAFPLVVVDNSRSPATRSVVERHGGAYLDPGANVGFAAGVNLALRTAVPRRADVLLLNPDAAIDGPAVDRLRACLHRDPSLGCVAPVQTEPVGGAGMRVSWPRPTPTRAWLEAVGLGRLPARRAFVTGSVLLLRAQAIEDVGLFDERFFLYAEETDWQIRARQKGWRAAMCSDVSAVHVGAGTADDLALREAHFHASFERLIRKHHGTVGWQVTRAGCVVGASLRSVILGGGGRRRARTRLRLYLEGPSRAEHRLASKVKAADRTDPRG